MESIKTALECMRKNCYMTSVDLKDAFFSIPMLEATHDKYRELLKRKSRLLNHNHTKLTLIGKRHALSSNFILETTLKLIEC